MKIFQFFVFDSDRIRIYVVFNHSTPLVQISVLIKTDHLIYNERCVWTFNSSLFLLAVIFILDSYKISKSFVLKNSHESSKYRFSKIFELLLVSSQLPIKNVAIFFVDEWVTVFRTVADAGAGFRRNLWKFPVKYLRKNNSLFPVSIVLLLFDFRIKF